MSNSNSSSSGGISFFGLLTIVFITLKITDEIDWNWFWVLSPMIFSFGLWLVVLFILAAQR